MKAIKLMGLLLMVSGSLMAQDRAHELASQAGSQHAATCPRPNNLTLRDCHDQFKDGCSISARPTYDAYLNFLKNQDPALDLASTGVLAGADFSNLESQLAHLGRAPKKGAKSRTRVGLTSANHALFATQLAG